jgi:hypothetical protein
MGAEGFAGRVFVRKGAAARKIFLGTIVAMSITLLLMLLLKIVWPSGWQCPFSDICNHDVLRPLNF